MKVVLVSNNIFFGGTTIFKFFSFFFNGGILILISVHVHLIYDSNHIKINFDIFLAVVLGGANGLIQNLSLFLL